MEGVDSIDQQLHRIQVLRKTYKWHQKIIFRILIMVLLSYHKVYKGRRVKQYFLHFVHDVLPGLMVNATNLKSDPKKSHDSLLRLIGRHFASQTLYQCQAKDKKHSPRW